MGFNSVLVVLNDQLDAIERDPEFGKKVARAIREHDWPRRAPYVTGQTQVISVQHADCAQVIRIGGNTGRVLGYGLWTQTDDELIRSLESERRRGAKIKKEAETADD